MNPGESEQKPCAPPAEADALFWKHKRLLRSTSGVAANKYPHQKLALPVTLGNGITSRMFFIPEKNFKRL
ncbi:MAG: hypothetical protein CM1200mP28_09860 [Deltaproteobacteria bacterium]|nr:MAG: hypothetical protein CM1200mP28_09860 [Deltaproteobacteria bacterium]